LLATSVEQCICETFVFYLLLSSVKWRGEPRKQIVTHERLGMVATCFTIAWGSDFILLWRASNIHFEKQNFQRSLFAPGNIWAFVLQETAHCDKRRLAHDGKPIHNSEYKMETISQAFGQENLLTQLFTVSK
jgi:hypothetical protein